MLRRTFSDNRVSPHPLEKTVDVSQQKSDTALHTFDDTEAGVKAKHQHVRMTFDDSVLATVRNWFRTRQPWESRYVVFSPGEKPVYSHSTPMNRRSTPSILRAPRLERPFKGKKRVHC